MTITDLLALWPSIKDVAEDAGVTANQPHVWKHRGEIPAVHWTRLVNGARARGIDGVTYELLASLAKDEAAA